MVQDNMQALAKRTQVSLFGFEGVELCTFSSAGRAPGFILRINPEDDLKAAMLPPYGRNRIAWQRVRCSCQGEKSGGLFRFLKLICTFSSAGRAPDS